MNIRYDDRVAIVTGAGGLIGRWERHTVTAELPLGACDTPWPGPH